MELGIAGKRALVAASSKGLGLATARALAEAGCQVVVSGRTRDTVDRAAEELGATPLVWDVGSVEGATQFVEAGREALGGLDILVINGGGPPPGTFESTDLDAYPEAIAMNLLSVVAMCKAAAPGMCEQGWGRILAITSISVRQPIPHLILSNTARTGATSFLKTLALEIAEHGVTVNSIQPGLHLTDRVRSVYGDKAGDVAASLPVGVMGRPDDFGQVAAFLCSDQARFITGAAVPVAGGADIGLQ